MPGRDQQAVADRPAQVGADTREDLGGGVGDGSGLVGVHGDVGEQRGEPAASGELDDAFLQCRLGRGAGGHVLADAAEPHQAAGSVVPRLHGQEDPAQQPVGPHDAVIELTGGFATQSGPQQVRHPTAVTGVDQGEVAGTGDLERARAGPVDGVHTFRPLHGRVGGVHHEPAGGGQRLAAAHPLLARGQRLLGEDLLGQVAYDHRAPDDRTAVGPEREHGHRCGDAKPGRVPQLDAHLLQALAGKSPPEQAGPALGLGEERVEGLAEHRVRLLAEQSLRGAVPAADQPVLVQSDDRTVGGVLGREQMGQPGRTVHRGPELPKVAGTARCTHGAIPSPGRSGCATSPAS